MAWQTDRHIRQLMNYHFRVCGVCVIKFLTISMFDYTPHTYTPGDWFIDF